MKEEKVVTKVFDWRKLALVILVIAIAVNVIVKLFRVRTFNTQMNSALTNELYTEEEQKELKAEDKKEVEITFDEGTNRYIPKE